MTMNSIPMKSHLLELPLFDGLDGAALERIAAGASEVNAHRGALIFRRGDACRGLYIVINGQVTLALQGAQGNERIVELVGPGGTFGETAIFLDRPYLFTASTLADTRLAQVSKATVLAELERTPREQLSAPAVTSKPIEFPMGILAGLFIFATGPPIMCRVLRKRYQARGGIALI